MYIGILDPKEISYTHKGTGVPFLPSDEEGGAKIWRWNFAFDDAIDVNLSLTC